jgi:hypothetical protein
MLFQDLPNEIVWMIWTQGNLFYTDVLHCASTCQRYYALFSKETSQKHLVQQKKWLEINTYPLTKDPEILEIETEWIVETTFGLPYIHLFYFYISSIYDVEEWIKEMEEHPQHSFGIGKRKDEEIKTTIIKYHKSSRSCRVEVNSLETKIIYPRPLFERYLKHLHLALSLQTHHTQPYHYCKIRFQNKGYYATHFE